MSPATPITKDGNHPCANPLAMILGFAWVSIAGLISDCALFAILIATGVQSFPANLLSAGVAVTFVFFASVRQVFRFQGGHLWPRYIGYAAFQLVAVTAASLLIAWLQQSLSLPALACKLAVLPLTFTGNLLFMRLITRQPGGLPS